LRELICDTSALIALQQVGLLHILSSLSPSAIVPAAVEQELAIGRAGGHIALDIAAVNWLTVRTPTARPTLPNAKLLGPGESDVLWIALEIPGSVAVLEDAFSCRPQSHH
jgi:predicted nucleic acid-binding protein